MFSLQISNMRPTFALCRLSMQNLKQHGICRRKRQPLSCNNIWSLLQKYLVPFQTIFGLLPKENVVCVQTFCASLLPIRCRVYNTDWHRIWHKSSLPIDRWSSFVGCDRWINGGCIFIFLCIWLRDQLGKRTGGSQGLTGNNVMTVGRNALLKHFWLSETLLRIFTT